MKKGKMLALTSGMQSRMTVLRRIALKPFTASERFFSASQTKQLICSDLRFT